MKLLSWNDLHNKILSYIWLLNVTLLALKESDCTFNVGLRSWMNSISLTRQSNLFLHFLMTLKRARKFSEQWCYILTAMLINRWRLLTVTFNARVKVAPLCIEHHTESGGAKVQVTGYRSQVTGNRLQVTGLRLQVTGHRLQVKGKNKNYED